MDVSLLQTDPLSENMAAFCSQSGSSDCECYLVSGSSCQYQHNYFASFGLDYFCHTHSKGPKRSQLHMAGSP